MRLGMSAGRTGGAGLVGARLELGHGCSLFCEHKASYTWNDADLKGGGSLKADMLTHQFAVGVSYAFGGPTQY
jgi:lipid A oxidase